MNKPYFQTSLVAEKSEAKHLLPRNHKGTSKELPEILYKNGKGAVDRVNRSNLEAWTREARSGKPQAQYNLGVVYFKGVGVTPNHEEAFKWFTRAAEKGSASGQGFLGVMYENGLGVSQDHDKSVHWYRKAAEQEDSTAQFNLARLCYQGNGKKRAPEEAVKWFEKAAEKNNDNAQNML
ncbi:MAG: sel1 repeat family protein, partial [Nitrospina sp.]|nr:sel1 repeat family protein [Nitrospina sp.]